MFFMTEEPYTMYVNVDDVKAIEYESTNDETTVYAVTGDGTEVELASVPRKIKMNSVRNYVRKQIDSAVRAGCAVIIIELDGIQ